MFETRFCKVLGPDIKYLEHFFPFSGGPTKPTASATRIFQTLTHSHYRNIVAVMLKLDILAQRLLVNTKKLVPAIIKQYVWHNSVSK